MTQEILESDSSWPYSKAKTAVLSAAVAVISQGGPRAATLKNIANRASITEPAIFRHFDGVDGLFSGLFEAFEFVHARIEAAYDREERGLGRLLAALLSIADIAATGEDFAYILVHGEHVFRGYRDLNKKLAELRKRTWTKLLSCVEEGVSAGEIRRDIDPESLAYAADGAVQMTIRAWIESGFSFDLRKACEIRAAMIERMLTPAEALRTLPKRTFSTASVAKPAAASRRGASAKPAAGKPASKRLAAAKGSPSKASASKGEGAPSRGSSSSGRPAKTKAKAKESRAVTRAAR